MQSNGFYHSALRRLPFSLLGVVILHLPLTWSRLQYLAGDALSGISIQGGALRAAHTQGACSTLQMMEA